MRSFLSKPLKLTLEHGLRQRVGTAVRVRLPSGPPGSLAWLVAENENANAYFILVISPRDDKFTIELAWSLKKRVPEHMGKIPGEEGKTGELRFRLSRLWQPNGFEVWYDLQYDDDDPHS